MAVVLSVLFALLAAVGNAGGTVLQRVAARRVPLGDAFSVRLVRRLVHSKAWLCGIAAIVAAAVCQALALTLGSLSLVQPLLVTELPFTLVLARAAFRRRLAPLGWVAAVTVAAGLGLGLVAASPTGEPREVAAATWTLALLAAGAAMAVGVLAALRRPQGKARAALFSSASAIGYAVTATLMKSATDTFSERGATAFFTAWQTYGLFVAGACSLFLLANAMEAGPLVASQPVLTLGEALVSLALGIVVYGDNVRTGWWLIPEAVGAVLITWGTLILPGLDSGDSETSAT
ncbi:DMT family transporter [Streptomyces axinellae]|uniref:DMT family transporter n=1 Tax=Streptomyces axinellae TaxID=552788 RepID=A0ABN3PYM0_9ACTN